MWMAPRARKFWKIHITSILHFNQWIEGLGGFRGVRLTDGLGVPSAFFPEEHSKAWWLPFFFLLPSGSRSLVCVSFKNLFIHFVVRFIFWKASQMSWALRNKAWIPGSPLPCACQVEGEAEGRSEL